MDLGYFIMPYRVLYPVGGGKRPSQSVGIIPFEEPARGILITGRSFSIMFKSIFEILWGI